MAMPTQRSLSLHWARAAGASVSSDNFTLRTTQASIDGESLQHAPWAGTLGMAPPRSILSLRQPEALLRRSVPVYRQVHSAEALLSQLLHAQSPLLAALFSRFDALAKALTEARREAGRVQARLARSRQELASERADAEAVRGERDARLTPDDDACLATAYTKEKARAVEMTEQAHAAHQACRRLRAELACALGTVRELDWWGSTLSRQLTEAASQREAGAAAADETAQLRAELSGARRDAERATDRAARAEASLQAALGGVAAGSSETEAWAVSQLFQRAIAEADAAAASSASREAEARRREVSMLSTLESVKAELRAADRTRVAAVETAAAELRAAGRARAGGLSPPVGGIGGGPSASAEVALTAEARLRVMEHRLNLRSLAQEHEAKRLSSQREAGEAWLREAELRARVQGLERERDAVQQTLSELQAERDKPDPRTVAAIGLTQSIVHRAAVEQARLRRERDDLRDTMRWLLARLRERSLGALAAEATARADVQRAIGGKATQVAGARAAAAISRASLEQTRLGLATIAADLRHALPTESIG
jgi:hypothetical protein